MTPIINLNTPSGRLLDQYIIQLKFHEAKVEYYKQAIKKLKEIQFKKQEEENT